MSSDAAQNQAQAGEEDQATASLPMPQVSLPSPRTKLDLATLLGVVGSLALIAAAIYMGKSDASFINYPSILMVILGTITATSISFTSDELSKAWSVFKKITDPACIRSFRFGEKPYLPVYYRPQKRRSGPKRL